LAGVGVGDLSVDFFICDAEGEGEGDNDGETVGGAKLDREAMF